MPTYVYECRTCERVFEAEQRITEDPLKDCDCGATDSLRRLIQPVGIAFKGSGFHINDYASKPTTASEPTSTPSAPAAPAASPATPSASE